MKIEITKKAEAVKLFEKSWNDRKDGVHPVLVGADGGFAAGLKRLAGLQEKVDQFIDAAREADGEEILQMGEFGDDEICNAKKVKQQPLEWNPAQLLKHDRSADAALVHLELEEPWMILTALGFGGFNECPMPDQQGAIMRYCGEKYGARVVAVSKDTVECYVERPPQTKEEAIKLAIEQCAYSFDLPGQVYDGPEELASKLWKSNYWFFWWD